MYEMLRGWVLLCKFMYFPTNAVLAEYFSLVVYETSTGL